MNNNSRIGALVLTIAEHEVLHVGDVTIEFMVIGKSRIKIKCVGPTNVRILRDKVYDEGKRNDSANNDAE